MPRRDDGAPAILWHGSKYHKVRALYKLDRPGDKVIGFAAQPLPSTVTGRPQDMPERMYMYGVYDYTTGEMICQTNIRREQLATLRDHLQSLLDEPLPPEETP